VSFQNLEGQTARRLLRLQEYDLISEHNLGWKHNNADALSRRRCQEECTHYHKLDARADIKQVRAIVTAEAAGRHPELNDQDMGPILNEGETGQCPEWEDITNLSPTYKSYWAQ
jgi:hypothetical protein